jgi:hypothetical protein
MLLHAIQRRFATNLRVMQGLYHQWRAATERYHIGSLQTTVPPAANLTSPTFPVLGGTHEVVRDGLGPDLYSTLRFKEDVDVFMEVPTAPIFGVPEHPQAWVGANRRTHGLLSDNALGRELR